LCRGEKIAALAGWGGRGKTCQNPLTYAREWDQFLSSGWPRSFRWSAWGVVATSDSSRSLPIRGRSGRSRTHLGQPLEPPPVSPARGPPTDWGELVQVHNECDATQTSPDELPDIDIHSL